MKTIAKALTTAMSIASILFIVWFVASWVDVIADNTSPNPVHSEYNLFVMMVESAEKN